MPILSYAAIHGNRQSCTAIAVAVAALTCISGCNRESGGASATTDTTTIKPAPSTALTDTSMTGATASVGGAASTGAMPPALDAVGTHGEDLYDAVKAKNWTKSATITDSLDASVRALASSGQNAGADQTLLTAELDTLHRTVPAHQGDAAIKAANRVTYLAARMSAQYHPTIPAEVAMLDFYGRELEIWSADNNSTKLSQTAADIKQTWNTLRPAVEAHGGATAAKRTDDLIAQVVAAKSTADYKRVATPILDEVDLLEKVFSK
ncbi:MAG TPA: hypothetical protein VIG47_07435 [Gemmatimonadaceae bacterium]|jgi:hypothetical protein